ncbi:MobF family relaxase [Xenorhabdus ishibashii]|uniref:Conjugative relaxase n=1 Tax=Xenorhabdus ishibashii TaxID=1034471 RepID=A0A2D0K7Z4_9GAMM|nr:MobF family relaxase [Xenorhabdus ishibashii]PHM59480.1 conjugative relaxase [Xenorhabdus ishibashii]
MLSLSRVRSASGAASYYEQEDNYYFLGEATTSWFGKGAESLGLTGQVNREDFKNVLEGKLPNGESLEHIVNGENKHRPGYDLTFSAPKSVSVLALVVGDKAVLDAHNTAVKKTLTELEKMASTRIMKEGIVSVEETNNITAALFLHDTSRNLEPALHTHAILSNVTETKEGNWRTLSADRGKDINAFIETIWKNPVAIGGLYRQFLKPELKELGYSFIDAGKHGQFEIEGVPTEMFSSRRQEIIDAVGENATAKQKSVAAKDTRKKKDFTNIEEVRESWKTKLSETGFDHESIKGTKNIEIVKNDEGSDIRNTVKTAIANLGKESAKFTHDKLLTQVINSMSMSQFSGIDDLREIIKDEIKLGNLVPLKDSGDLFTTIEHLKNETNVIKNINKLNHDKVTLVSKETNSLANYMTSNENQFKSLTLRGGSDFSIKTLNGINELARENSKENIIIVPNNKSKSFFKEYIDKNVSIFTAKEIESTHEGSFKNSIVSVYQTENMKLDSINAILNKSKNQHSVVVSIDTGTKNSEGIFVDLLKKTKYENFKLYEENEKKHVYFVSDIDKSDRVKLATKQYLTLSVNNKDAIVQVHDNKSKNQVNDKIRESLINNGILSDRHIHLDNEKQVFLSDANRNLRSTYRKGLILENTKEKERFTITDIDKSNNDLRLINDSGKISNLSISDIDKHYNLIEKNALEIRVGEKLRTYQRFDNVKANSEYMVSGFRKGNFLFGERVILEDKDGNKITINPNKTTKLDYNYSETFGNSINKERTVIALLNKNDVSSTTLNKIKKSGDSIIAITGLSKKQSETKINKSDVSINHIPENNGNIFDTLSKINDLKKDTVSDLDKIIDLSIEKSSGGKVYFNGSAVILHASNLDNKLTLEQLSDSINHRIEKGSIIPIGSTSLTDNYVKRETLNNEVNIVRKIFEGKNKAEPLIKGEISLENTSLTKGQKAASELLLTSKDTIIAIQGYAGVGKTTQFRTVSEAIKSNRTDIELRGLAPTHKAVSELKSAGIESQTIASFLQEMASGDVNANYQNTVFVIDESSMVGNKGLSNLLDTIIENKGRVILSGDKQQLKSFESGAPFKLTLERSAIDHVVMDEIVRQTPELKPAVEAIIKGKVNESISVIEKVSPTVVPRVKDAETPSSSVIDLNDKSSPEKIVIIAEDFASRTPEARNDTFIITPLNADRNAINESIHSTLVQNGSLENSVRIPTYQRINSQEYELKSTKYWSENIGHTAKIGKNYFQIQDVNKEGIISLRNLENNHESAMSALEVNSHRVAIYQDREIDISVGEKIRLTVTDVERNAFNNDMGVVKSIKDDQITMDFNGKEITYSPKEQLNDRHLDYSYAITSYSSQGASIPYVIVYDGVDGAKRSLAALDSTYVELSRSKEHVQLYIDDIDKWEKHLQYNSGERSTAHNVLHNVDNQLAEKALKKWNESTLISGDLADKLPSNLQEIAKYSGKEQEILLPVHDDYGVQRGNYHIPVGIFSGSLNIDQGHYNGASDGTIIVLNRGDSELDTLIYDKNDIDKAINNDNGDNAIIIKLDEADKPEINEIPLSKEEIKLQETIEEVMQQNKEKDVKYDDNEQKEMLLDSIIEAKQNLDKDIDTQNEYDSKESDKRIRHDEENIIRHQSEKDKNHDMDITF